jgi:hypothetical protein
MRRRQHIVDTHVGMTVYQATSFHPLNMILKPASPLRSLFNFPNAPMGQSFAGNYSLYTDNFYLNSILPLALNNSGRLYVNGASNENGLYQAMLGLSVVNIINASYTATYFTLNTVKNALPATTVSLSIGNGRFGIDVCDSPSTEHVLRYDYEAQRWLIVFSTSTLQSLCVAISADSLPYNTSLPANMTYMVYQIPIANQTIYGLRFSIWGDYYNVCWSGMCHVLERSVILAASGMPRIMLISNSTAVMALSQGNSTRGSVLMSASCGIALNSVSGSIYMTQCMGVNFTNATIMVSETVTPVAPWNNGTASLPTSTGFVIDPISNDTEAAYYNFGGVEQMAWAVTIDCDGIQNSKVRWSEFVLNVGSLTLLNTNYTYNPDSGSHIWSPVLAYNGNRTLALMYSSTNATHPAMIQITYRLATFPIGLWDQQIIISTSNVTVNATFERGALSTFGSNIPRAFFTATPSFRTPPPVYDINFYQYLVALVLIRNETILFNYTAIDSCGFSSSCIQQVNLS